MLSDQAHKERAKSKAVHRQVLFGLFLQRYMIKRGISKTQLMQKCFMPEEGIDEMLQGNYPGELISDDLIEDLADALNAPVNVFHIILDRDLHDRSGEMDLQKTPELTESLMIPVVDEQAPFSDFNIVDLVETFLETGSHTKSREVLSDETLKDMQELQEKGDMRFIREKLQKLVTLLEGV